MGAITEALTETPQKKRNLVEMNWDPITRIVGGLGIFTKIDFENKQVAECYSTSSIFRGYSIFMKSKDLRDAHFITSRICGICGDNHATCACYAQNMAFGVKPPPLAEWIINLGEAAEYMFDHNIFQDNLVGVDFCERMVKETNPSLWEKAQRKKAPHADKHGYRTIADIMTALNPFTGEFYRETLIISRLTREMFCLMEGRHVHPSTLYPGGVGTVATVQLFTDYLVRLIEYVDFMKKCVPLHDDLFDFWYEALPGYEKVGQRRIQMGCWGSFNDPNVCDYRYESMSNWDAPCLSPPASSSMAKWSPTIWWTSTSAFAFCLAVRSSMTGRTKKLSCTPIRSAIQSTSITRGTRPPRRGRRNATSTAITPGSCRRAGTTNKVETILRLTPAAAPSRASGPPPSQAWWTSAISKPPGTVSRSTCPLPETSFEWKIPQWSNAIERDRARTYFQAYAAAAALYFCEKAMEELMAGHSKTWTPFKVPEEAISCGFHEAVRGVLSHHVVIRDGKIANYHPYPPTCWNANPRDIYGTPGPYEDAVQNTPIFEENGPENFRGIDIMRAVRSFDPCLPCGVHMYLGNGKVIETRHSPMFGHQVSAE